MVPEVPIPIIEGGTERIVSSKQPFTVDGSKSIDMDVAPKEPPHLLYEWTCQVIQGAVKDFCDEKSTGFQYFSVLNSFKNAVSRQFHHSPS